MPYIPYRFNDFSIFHFCPFKSFCFTYRSFRSLQSSFMRPNCARTPPGNPALSSYIPVQTADCIIIFLYLLPQTYPFYQPLNFLVCFIKVCFCHDFSTPPCCPCRGRRRTSHFPGTACRSCSVCRNSSFCWNCICGGLQNSPRRK